MGEPHARSRTGGASSLATMDGAVDLARDRALVEACQAGDETAFTELYSRYHRRLLRFCLQRLHAADDAEEAVQESFTRAWRALPRFAGERRFYPWLTVIAANVCTDTLRRRSRLVPLDEVPSRAADGAASEADVDERLLRQADLAMATEALRHLSDRHQRVLRLREATEWTSQRIAEHEGVAVPAVDTLLWRARQAFKREFAALSEGGLAAAVGMGIAALRRTLARAGTRMGALAAFPTRSPGALVATAAITGAAVAGGGIALLGAMPHAASPARAAIGGPVAAATAPAAGPAVGTGEATSSGPGAAAGWRASGTRAGSRMSSKVATATAARSAPGGAASSPPSGVAGVVDVAGGTSALPLGSTNPVGALGAAGQAATGTVGRVVGTGLNALGQVLGLTHATASGTPGSTSGTTGSTGTTGSSTGSGGGTTTAATLGTTSGAVGTAVTGATGAVTTTVGTASQSVLGTSL